jgi:hypothetical protein
LDETPRLGGESCFTAAHWLGHCEGFQIRLPDGQAGFVEEVRFGSGLKRPEALAVRLLASFGGSVVVVPAEEVEEIIASEERLLLRAPSQLAERDLADGLKARLHELAGAPLVGTSTPRRRKERERARAEPVRVEVEEEAEGRDLVELDPDADAKSSELAEAYEVLSLLYDRFGSRGWERADGSGPAAGAGDVVDFAKARARRSKPAPDTAVELTIDAHEAARGTVRNVQFAVVAPCGGCRGEGAPPGVPWQTCAACRGSGRLRRISISTTGQLFQIDDCGECDGRGRVPSETCSECGGDGRVKLERVLDVQIPARTRDGQRISLTDDGPAEALAGDAYVVVRVAPLPDVRFLRHASAAGLVLAVATLVALLFFS